MHHSDAGPISFFQEFQHSSLSVFIGDRGVIWCDEEDEDQSFACGSGSEMDSHCINIMIQVIQGKNKLYCRKCAEEKEL